MTKKLWKERILALLFPSRCAICDATVKYDKHICNRCMDEIKTLEDPTCIKCGKKIKTTTELVCHDCSTHHHYFDRGYALFDYQQVKTSLYRFKYAGRAEYAKYYAQVAEEKYGTLLKQLKADALIPVPIHKRRLKERGYNQAEEFSKELSNRLGIPTRTDLVKRTTATVALKKLGRFERQNNLKKAFIISRNDVKLKTIIVIDDIYTTGATIDTISRIFRHSGVEKIFFLTVAIGRGI